MKKINKKSLALRENSLALLCIFFGQTAHSPRHYTHNAPITKIGVHLRFLKNVTSWTRHLKFLTVCMVPLHICQPCVLERRSGVLDQPTLPFLVCPFLQSVACFLFIVDAHLLTSCMALQTVQSVMIAVYEGQLAWAVWHCRPFAVCKGQLACRRCSPSILKKWNLTNWSS